MPALSGVYVQAACFCEMAIKDDSGALSLIRIIDVITHTQRGPHPPQTMPAVTFPLRLVIMLQSGSATGRYEVRVAPQRPTGETDEPLRLPVLFEGEGKGQNIVANWNYTFTMEGLHWFRVYLDDDELTAIPMHIRYEPVVTTSGVC